MGVRVILNERGGKRAAQSLLDRLRLTSYVEVGILGPKARQYSRKNKNVTVGEVATFLEYGTKTIPARPAIGGWFDKNQASNLAFARQLALKRMRGQMSIDQSLRLMGLRAVAGIQEGISMGILPPNAKSTIKRKGSSKPWIDTGQTRSSFTFRVVSGRVRRR